MSSRLWGGKGEFKVDEGSVAMLWTGLEFRIWGGRAERLGLGRKCRDTTLGWNYDKKDWI